MFVGTILTAALALAAHDCSAEGTQIASVVDTAVHLDELPLSAHGGKYARALRSAARAAREHPYDLGYPWLDGNDVLVQRIATTEGANYVASIMEVPSRIIHAPASYAELERIKLEITSLADIGYPGAGLIWKVRSDHMANQIVVHLLRPNGEVLKDLKELYGDNVVVVIDELAEFEAGECQLGRDSDGRDAWSCVGPAFDAARAP